MPHFNRSQKRAALRLAVYAGLAILALLLIWLASNGWGLTCVFEQLWGFRCPACGATTALGALLRLDFAAAFQANPVFAAAIYPLGSALAIQDAAIAAYHLLRGGVEHHSLLQWLCGEGKRL